MNRRRKQRPKSSAPTESNPPRGNQENYSGIMNFYADDAPGFKIGPTPVLIICISFIGIVVLLHIFSKLRG